MISRAITRPSSSKNFLEGSILRQPCFGETLKEKSRLIPCEREARDFQSLPVPPCFALKVPGQSGLLGLCVCDIVGVGARPTLDTVID